MKSPRSPRPHTGLPAGRGLPLNLRLGLGLGLGLGLAACGEPAAPRPNILVVTLDTTRADRMACYGYGKTTTPVIDSIADLGWRFDHAISTAGITPVAHASLFTGLWPHHHGLRVLSGDDHFYLDQGFPTLASLLGERGWKTGATVSAYPASDAYGLGSGFDDFASGLMDGDERESGEGIEYWVDAPRTAFQRRADDTTDEAIRWVEEQADEPWCLWVHYFDPHDLQLVPPAEFLAKRGVPIDEQLPGANVAVRERYYDAELEFMDREFGRLIAHLDRTGQMEDTILVLVADHGQGLTDGHKRHGWFGHRILYDWCLRVPLILRLPGRGSGVIEDTVRVTDILPTLLEALDIGGENAFDGKSLLPLIRGESEEPRIALAESLTLLDDHGAIRRLPERFHDDQFAIFEGRWKLIANRNRPQRDELYDLSSDPLEMRDIAADHPKTALRLRERLEAEGVFATSTAKSSRERPDSGALTGLGYTGNDDEDEE